MLSRIKALRTLYTDTVGLDSYTDLHEKRRILNGRRLVRYCCGSITSASKKNSRPRQLPADGATC
jgi:hypothetical protein